MSCHQMTETMSGLARAAVALDPADRRGAVRIPHCAPFCLRPLLVDGIGPPITVVLQDLSATGMGVIHSGPLPLLPGRRGPVSPRTVRAC